MTNIIEWCGAIYPSQKAVAQAAGRNPSTVAWHLQHYGNLDRMGGQNPGNSRPFEMDGRRWPSVTAFAAEAGVNRFAAMRWARTGQIDKLRAALCGKL